MFERRSLKWPITLGVIMIVLLLAILVGWVILAVYGAIANSSFAALYWTLLTVGTTFLVLVLVGVVMYLALSIKEINLNRRQSNFIDSVTHELKSPLASLKLYLQTLNRRRVSPDEQQDFFRIMLDDVERLDHLINHLLDTASLQRRASDAEIESVDITAIIRTCVEELRLRYKIPAEQVSLSLEPFTVQARRVDVDMVFRNLIDNALKYGGDPPELKIDVHGLESNEVLISVSDNGHGVPRRYRHKIFRRFVRLGSELERHKPGTGLGLYIVQTLVQRMRGRIRVRDSDDGTGTVFEVQLPAQPGVDVPTTTKNAPPHAAEVV